MPESIVADKESIISVPEIQTEGVAAVEVYVPLLGLAVGVVEHDGVARGLPLEAGVVGDRVSVILRDGAREVIVKVNDRGPFGRGRIIDLSWSAAKELGMIAQGVTTVQVVPVSGSPGVPFRVDSILDLPEMDFEVAEAGYSILDAWKKDPTAKAISPPNPSNPKTPANRAGAPAEAGRNRHATTATNKQKAKPTKKGNKWSDVFEKIKNWGKDRI